MGIDTDGGMIIGAIGSDLVKCVPEDEEFNEWAEDNKLTRMAMHYDAPSEWCYYGFTVDDVRVMDIEGEWLTDVKEKADKFEKLTGIVPFLIGSQDVW